MNTFPSPNFWEHVLVIRTHCFEQSQIDNIKGNDTFLKIPNIDYSDSYISKLKKDFVKEENIIMPPIEIKEQQNAKRKDTKFYIKYI